MGGEHYVSHSYEPSSGTGLRIESLAEIGGNEWVIALEGELREMTQVKT